MFLENLQLTFTATMQVLLLAVAGYFTVKSRMLDDHGLDQLTAVLVNILLPCFAFTQLTQHFSFKEFPFWWHLPVLYLVMAFAALALAFVVGFGFKGQRKNEFLALVGFQNCGNVPLVVVAALFTGPTAHTLFIYIVLYIIGANLLIWSLGVWLLLRPTDRLPLGGTQCASECRDLRARPGAKFDLKKIINPPLLTTVLTMVMVGTGAQHFIPQVVLKPVEMLGNCALPLAMFSVGGGLASLNLRRIELGPMVMVILTKMVLFPLLVLCFVLAFKVNGLIGFLTILEAAVPSAVTLSLIKRYYNLDEDFVSEGVFVTHVASVITVPIFLTVYMKIAGPF